MVPGCVFHERMHGLSAVGFWEPNRETANRPRTISDTAISQRRLAINWFCVMLAWVSLSVLNAAIPPAVIVRTIMAISFCVRPGRTSRTR